MTNNIYLLDFNHISIDYCKIKDKKEQFLKEKKGKKKWSRNLICQIADLYWSRCDQSMINFETKPEPDTELVVGLTNWLALNF